MTYKHHHYQSNLLRYDPHKIAGLPLIYMIVAFLGKNGANAEELKICSIFCNSICHWTFFKEKFNYLEKKCLKVIL